MILLPPHPGRELRWSSCWKGAGKGGGLRSRKHLWGMERALYRAEGRARGALFAPIQRGHCQPQLCSKNCPSPAGAAVSGYRLRVQAQAGYWGEVLSVRVARCWNRLLREAVGLGQTLLRLLCWELSLPLGSDPRAHSACLYIPEALLLFPARSDSGWQSRGNCVTPGQGGVSAGRAGTGCSGSTENPSRAAEHAQKGL